MTQQRRRRTQAERSAATRENLLNAAIKCLCEYGYGATTMNMVAEEAGVTRGAIMHHFPSRADMMAHVVEAVTEESMAMYGDLLAGINDPRERMLAYPRVACEIDGRPAGIAVLEILLGSRSDREVADKLTPVQARIDATAETLLRQDLGRPPSSSLVFLIVAVSRGLSITEALAPGTDQAAGVIDLLQRLLRAGADAGVLPGTESGKA